MTVKELEVKLSDSIERVEKRKGTIFKVCKKLEIAEKDILDIYYSEVKDYSAYYLPSKTAIEIVSKVVQKKPERDEQGKWMDENYHFNFVIEQLEDNLKKLYDIEKVAISWKEKYENQLNKENVEKIPSIWEFLCNWEIKSIEWYKKNAIRYFDLKEKEESELYNYKTSEDYQKKLNQQIEVHKTHCLNFEAKQNSILYNIIYKLEREWKSDYYSSIDDFTKEIVTSFRNRTIDEEKLLKAIAKEKLDKYFDLVNRITKVVGEIKDANHLSIGEQKGEINGYIDGVKGRVKIETISAGGYNIQRFHYRVLIHKM